MRPFVAMALLAALSQPVFAAREVAEKTSPEQDNACALLVANAVAGSQLTILDPKTKKEIDNPQAEKLIAACRANKKMCASTRKELAQKGKKVPPGLACSQSAGLEPFNYDSCVRACENSHTPGSVEIKTCLNRCLALGGYL